MDWVAYLLVVLAGVGLVWKLLSKKPGCCSKGCTGHSKTKTEKGSERKD